MDCFKLYFKPVQQVKRYEYRKSHVLNELQPMLHLRLLLSSLDVKKPAFRRMPAPAINVSVEPAYPALQSVHF